MSTTDELQSNILKSLADETRIRLIRLLSKEILNVQELCDILNVPQPRVSRHLSVLKTCGIVTDQREGSHVYYRIGELDGELQLIASYIQSISEQNHPDFERMEVVLQKRTVSSKDKSAHLADRWDEVSTQLHNSFLVTLCLANLIQEKQVIADFGTGTGLLLPILSEISSVLYAVDHSSEMLEYAKKRCRDKKLDHVKFIETDIESVQLPEPCDAALLHFVMHQLSRPQQAIQAIAKTLKTGGRIVIVDRLNHEDESVREELGSIWLGFMEEQLRDWLTQSNFTNIKFQTIITGSAADEIQCFVAVAENKAP
ncbi:MAG: metalloregulator ArsR/SmtB family transcription factor [Lentisphaeria bacterium]|nr:metalloregulator ArsR/SmtB family transcription factor [Lentisphaeria bacterium]NQZ67325.1 metalloregulator ArsR/SmtB family transcription factor [Lentisphaeria bacterium]